MYPSPERFDCAFISQTKHFQCEDCTTTSIACSKSRTHCSSVTCSWSTESWDCTESEGCCLYSTGSGLTTAAPLNEPFRDGCNRCFCSKSVDNRGPWACTRMMCSCPYQNWDKVTGWAKLGSRVEVFDDKGNGGKGCRKVCKCVSKGYVDVVDCESQPCESTSTED